MIDLDNINQVVKLTKFSYCDVIYQFNDQTQKYEEAHVGVALPMLAPGGEAPLSPSPRTITADRVVEAKPDAAEEKADGGAGGAPLSPVAHLSEQKPEVVAVPAQAEDLAVEPIVMPNAAQLEANLLQLVDSPRSASPQPTAGEAKVESPVEGVGPASLPLTQPKLIPTPPLGKPPVRETAKPAAVSAPRESYPLEGDSPIGRVDQVTSITVKGDEQRPSSEQAAAPAISSPIVAEQTTFRKAFKTAYAFWNVKTTLDKCLALPRFVFLIISIASVIFIPAMWAVTKIVDCFADRAVFQISGDVKNESSVYIGANS